MQRADGKARVVLESARFALAVAFASARLARYKGRYVLAAGFHPGPLNLIFRARRVGEVGVGCNAEVCNSFVNKRARSSDS